MASCILANSTAQLNGKTALLLETAATVTGGVTPASDAVQVGWMLRKQLVLTDAQIKALPTTPITLVSAPTSGFRVKVLGASATLVTTAGAYTNINATYCAVQLQVPTTTWAWGPLAVNDSSLTTDLTQVTATFGGTVAKTWDVPEPATPIDAGSTSGTHEYLVSRTAADTADWNGTALQIATDNNGSGVWTGGNAANTLRVTVYYTVEPVA